MLRLSGLATRHPAEHGLCPLERLWTKARGHGCGGNFMHKERQAGLRQGLEVTGLSSVMC